MLETTKYQEQETFRNLPTTFTSTMTRLHLQLHVDMQEQDYRVSQNRSVQAKF